MASLIIRGRTVFGKQIPDPLKLFQTSEDFWSFRNQTIEPDKGSAQPFIINYGGPEPSFESGPYPGLSALRLEPNVRLKIPTNIWNVVTNPTSHTIAFWVKPNALATTGQECVLLGSCFGPLGVFFTLSNVAPENFGDRFNQDVTYWVATDANYQYVATTFPFITETDKWYHLAGVYNLQEQTASLYINGVKVQGSTEIIVSNVQHPDWDGLVFNGSPVGSGDDTGVEYGNNYSFSMAGFWSKALTDQEILALYNYRP
jgi:hypothetical protein